MSNETRFDSTEDGIKAIARGEMVICVEMRTVKTKVT